MKQLEREYSPSSCVQDITVYINQYTDKSAEVRKSYESNFKPDVKYGPEARSAMDYVYPGR